jgi:hypothetical protein
VIQQDYTTASTVVVRMIQPARMRVLWQQTVTLCFTVVGLSGYYPSTSALAFGVRRGSRSNMLQHGQRTFTTSDQSRTAANNRYPTQSRLLSATAGTVSSSSSSSTDGHDDDLFDDETWQAYQNVIQKVMQEQRVLKKNTIQDMEPIRDYLLSNRVWLDPPAWLLDNNNNNSARFDLKEQKQRFLNETGLSTPQYDYAMRCLTYTGDVCAKEKLAGPVVVAWHKLKESGMIPRENCVSTFMYILGLDDNVRAQDTCLEVATFHDLLFPPNEKTGSLRIKMLIAKGDAAGAERILSSLPDKGNAAEWKRLRTFLPILTHYCAVGDMSSTLRLFRQMRDSEGAFLDADTYALIIGALARLGYFRQDATHIQGATENGFTVACGPGLLDEIASELADEMLELTESAAKLIFDSFRLGFTNDPDAVTVEVDEGVPQCLELDEGLLLGRVRVNGTTAVCPESGARLRLFTLTNNQRRHVHDTLLDMAASQHEEYGGTLKARGKKTEQDSRNGTFAYDELAKFSKWLGINTEPYTAFVDGPNVGYFGHGDVHYSQVRLVVEQLERMGERPLVIMPQKYTAPKFWLNGLGYSQELTKAEREILLDLLTTGKMYVVPSGCLDDYYWMLASVANQTDSRLHVSTDDAQGRLPGLRPLLISNDLMRDHRLELLEPRLFRRWTSGHIVNYGMKLYSKNEWEERHVKFVPADFFSREIQCNKVEGSGSDCTAWHFPVTGWDEPDRLCVYIRQ